jgi:hypothetical protein
MDTDTDYDNHRDNYKNLPMQGFYLRFFDIKNRVNYSKKLAKLVRIYTAENPRISQFFFWKMTIFVRKIEIVPMGGKFLRSQRNSLQECCKVESMPLIAW